MNRGAPSGRTRDLALVLPVFGTLALVPPFIGLFARPGMAVAGIPLIVVYLFGLWLALILAALVLARRLAKDDGAPDGTDG